MQPTDIPPEREDRTYVCRGCGQVFYGFDALRKFNNHTCRRYGPPR